MYNFINMKKTLCIILSIVLSLCNVYGICYSVAGNSGFSVSTVNAKYKRIQFSNSAIKTYLSSQKNAIKKAVE